MTSSWQSGVYTDVQTQAAMNQFGTWRGQAIQMATIFPDSDSWADFTTNNWPYNLFDGAPYNVAITVPMIPKPNTGGTYSITDGVNGLYNSHWTDFANTLLANNLGNAILRLGWEFNGTWQPWVASNPTEWVAYWQVIVNKIRATAPNVKFCWNVNRGATSGQTDPRTCWPGASYVDIVGVDSYDTFPPCNPVNAKWADQVGGGGYGTGPTAQGLMDWLLWAKGGNPEGAMLKFAIPEWGNVTAGSADGLLWGAPNVGGDDSYYVSQMLAFFAAHNVIMEWESSFQGDSTGNIYQINGVTTTVGVPSSAGTYKAAF